MVSRNASVHTVGTQPAPYEPLHSFEQGIIGTDQPSCGDWFRRCHCDRTHGLSESTLTSSCRCGYETRIFDGRHLTYGSPSCITHSQPAHASHHPSTSEPPRPCSEGTMQDLRHPETALRAVKERPSDSQERSMMQMLDAIRLNGRLCEHHRRRRPHGTAASTFSSLANVAQISEALG